MCHKKKIVLEKPKHNCLIMPEEIINFRKMWIKKLQEKDYVWLYCSSGYEMELVEKYRKLGYKFKV